MILLGHNPQGQPILLPIEADQKIAVVAVSGAGKSYAAGRMAEDWLAAGVPVGILDPVGIWFGLRCGADGNQNAGIQIPILGGMHADNPLPEPEAAAYALARLGQSAIFDLSESRMEDLQLWAARFAESLMGPGNVPESPAHIILEEAPIFVPQSGSLSKHNKRCRYAFAHLARVGRNRGYGLTVITQRAAAVDKNVLTQCGSLLLLRIAADIDRKAITSWIAENAAGITREAYDTMLKELSEAKPGTGWLWSPQWGGGFTKLTVAPRRTLHPNARQRSQVLVPLIYNPYSSAPASVWQHIQRVGKWILRGSLIASGIVVAWYGLKYLIYTLGALFLLSAIGGGKKGRSGR
jgi:hypothetical protein